MTITVIDKSNDHEFLIFKSVSGEYLKILTGTTLGHNCSC